MTHRFVDVVKKRNHGECLLVCVSREWGVNAVEVAVRFKKGYVPLYPMASFSAVGDKTATSGESQVLVSNCS